ncbi:hypothetical protein MRB53_042295 [Persea americana]|nr:hypothetical protein MRB53_042295 [Persea americana]
MLLFVELAIAFSAFFFLVLIGIGRPLSQLANKDLLRLVQKERNAASDMMWSSVVHSDAFGRVGQHLVTSAELYMVGLDEFEGDGLMMEDRQLLSQVAAMHRSKGKTGDDMRSKQYNFAWMMSEGNSFVHPTVSINRLWPNP